MSFERVAIVNRGEPAMRLIRAVRDWNRQHGSSLRAIALHTEPDRRALFVREADESYALGSAIFEDPADGRRKSRYLDYETLERALRETRAEAAWVGWGFVSEHTRFAELCRDLGVVFLGPDPEVMRSLGDKIGSKRMAESAGVPVAPWSKGPVANLAAAREQAERLGYPLMIKATAGGGGRGIRRVYSPAELDDAFESASSEALKGFGDATVFMERLLEGARHVEVQIVGDGQGTTWALGVRDCTVQRRNQKVIEEAPSPGLDEDQHREVCDAAVRLGQAAGYRNAGTVEFLYDIAKRAFSFMEVNARLQVEHPITEITAGIDLVKLQLHVGMGGRLEGPPPAPRGHAIEVRLNAEDPERGFAPAPGLVELLRLPGGPGLRVDSGFAEGDRVAPEFDSMIAKVIASGRDRGEALARLERALREMRVAIRGGSTNKGFLLGLLQHPDVISGQVDVGWLDRLAAVGDHLVRRHADAALVQGAIEAYEEALGVERTQFYATAARGRLRLRDEVGVDVELRHRGASYALRVLRIGPDTYRVDVDGTSQVARVERLDRLERRLTIGDRSYHVVCLSNGPELLIEVNGVPHRLSRDEVGTVRAPAPSVVVSFTVEEGDEVAEGDRIVVLEAMKTELVVTAPCAGKVREIVAKPNVQVDTGAALVLLEPLARESEERSAQRVLFPAGAEPPPGSDPLAHCRANLGALKRLVLGFDLEAAEAARIAQETRSFCEGLPSGAPEILTGEEEILEVFADVCALFAHRGADAEGDEAEQRSPEEYLLLYLRSLDVESARLSPGYADRLRRALRHYGLEKLERTPRLEEALLWICKAHQRMGQQVSVVLGILERRLDCLDELGPLPESFRQLLDRVIAATRGRYQAVSDLADELRYRGFDRPFFDAIRERVYAEAERQLAALGAEPGPQRRGELLAQLVACPQPLVSLLCSRLGGASESQRRLVLEILMRRYYRIRALQKVRSFEREGWSFATAEYQRKDRRVHLVTTCADWNELGEAARATRPVLDELPAAADVVIDFYLWREAPHLEPAEVQRQICEELDAVDFGRPIRRVVAAIAARGTGRGMGDMQHFTFRMGDEGFQLDPLYRNLHAMMAKRLELWRLDNFEIERIPSEEDVYLFHGVARDNPRDERLFAFVEVRDLTPVRDASGKVIRLPHLEMMLMEALASIRLFQSRRAPHARLQWNRVILYVWPEVGLEVAELNQLAHRLAPAALDLGLQKIVARARWVGPNGDEPRERIIQLSTPGGREVVLSLAEPSDQPIAPLSEYAQKVVRMRQRGLTYPYEVIGLLTPPVGAAAEFPPGDFVEYDFDEVGRLVPVERLPGENRANVVVGKVRNFTSKHPEGMARVVLLGDPSRGMGSVSEAECRLINAALDLAEAERLPVDWFALSAGAKIAMDTGTETMDWCAAVIRRLVEFTQGGGEVNVVVDGINVGAQSYWNAEATMLMHTRGILIMTPNGSMVLTGKQALDYSGGVSAEDNQGIGGYDRTMGPNGQAQYWARDIGEACHLLLHHYEHAYVAPGERFPRRAPTSDPADRDVCAYPHGHVEGGSFDFVGDVFSDEKNPGRRRPFDIRRVMHAVVDQDHAPLPRWDNMREAESAVVWDVHLGGIPVCLIGMESHPITRLGFVPADGPDQWTGGTLFPLSSKKVARAINSASGNRPVAVLANLSGFDGSPESMRRLQLEYGAEIGRAVVNFEGPIVLCVVSRYHGGAYVVFSAVLNQNLQVAALEGSFASVIGGAPAAAVVFARDVERRTRDDVRLRELQAEIAAAEESERGRLRARWHELYEAVHAEKRGEVAEQFDSIHSVRRALEVGSLHEILPPSELRPFLIRALEKGMQRELGRVGAS